MNIQRKKVTDNKQSIYKKNIFSKISLGKEKILFFLLYRYIINLTINQKGIEITNKKLLFIVIPVPIYLNYLAIKKYIIRWL